MNDDDGAALLSGARSQLAKAIVILIGVSVFLWNRPDLGWVLVLGWCGAGAWLAFLNYRSAMRIVVVVARRRSEIEVKPC